MPPVSDSRDYSKDADTTLIALARAGDDEAFTEIVSRRHARVRMFMHYLCGHKDDGDDLAQQVFLKAWKTIRQLRSAAAFDSWLRRIMVTTWIEQTRRGKLHYVNGIDPEALTGRRETPGLGLDIKAALAGLSADARLCVMLAHNDGLTHDEIARITGMPLGTVKSHVARGSARLRQSLAAYGTLD